METTKQALILFGVEDNKPKIWLSNDSDSNTAIMSLFEKLNLSIAEKQRYNKEAHKLVKGFEFKVSKCSAEIEQAQKEITILNKEIEIQSKKLEMQNQELQIQSQEIEKLKKIILNNSPIKSF
ncbi:hypothetical protein [Spiroplasma alleghenense]|uniref:Uncharacterized protein n=1 Tax=Spiroplasma alleghenense TaxID=216931 RepID=A0A345Z5C3_9MOLU|nr:hypothetical protein [Spiroplasma alleghenense]AXK51802.1 hypothetical protein SALLE_v1c11320 [Spiroplasma alleghenense]